MTNKQNLALNGVSSPIGMNESQGLDSGRDAAIDICIEALCSLLDEAARNVEVSTADISGNFRTLAESANAQGGLLDKFTQVVGNLDHGEGKITLKQFIDMMSHQIGDTIDHIMTISEGAMSMAFSIESTVEQIDNIDRFIRQVHAINNQTRMLALNAAIEAARAGEAGRGFSVVANEVKQVSGKINSMANEMQSQISAVSKTLKSGQETLGKVAGIDLSGNIAARGELERLMAALLVQNESITKMIQQSSDVIREISSNIGRLTINMQFQDKNSQVIQSAIGLLQHIREINKERAVADASASVVDELMDMAKGIPLTVVRSRLLEVASQRGLRVPLEKPSATRDTGGKSSSDNVELF